jgi:hypothetical protein
MSAQENLAKRVLSNETRENAMACFANREADKNTY